MQIAHCQESNQLCAELATISMQVDMEMIIYPLTKPPARWKPLSARR